MNEKKKMPMNPNTLPRLMKYLFKYYKPHLIITAVCIVVNALASVAATAFLQRLIDECITPGLTLGYDAVKTQIGSILLSMGTLYVLGILASFIYTRLMAVVSQGTLKHFRVDMFDRMESLPIKYFDTHPHGDIMSTYTNDTDTLRQLVNQSIPQVFQAALTLISIVCLMLYYSLWLTIIVFLAAALMLSISKKLAGASGKYMMMQQKSLAAEEGFVEEMMAGQKVVKVFNHEEEAKEDFLKLNDALFEAGKTANTYGNILGPVIGNVGNLLYVVLAIVGALLICLGVTNVGFSGAATISAGIIVSFLSMARQFSQTIMQASMQVGMIAMGLAGAGRVFELMDEEPEQDEGYVTLVNAKKDANGNITESEKTTGLWAWKHPHMDGSDVTYTELKGDITLDGVDFGYVPEKMVLHDISIYAKPGEKIAFVGATGAGKTTITNLINRFYDIEDGKVRYDGININKIKKPDLRKSLGIVLQDVNLFTGTVMDNIRYGRLDATDEECIEAAKLTNADSFISRLPEGYNTMLTGNGANLSQGQRQLLSIARAAVADPPCMVLDEATSSIDTRTEALVQEGMDNLMKGRTVFVIAHRLSTVRNSNAIMVLDHGRIIERGDHNDLINQRGTYYQLYTGAFELE